MPDDSIQPGKVEFSAEEEKAMRAANSQTAQPKSYSTLTATDKKTGQTATQQIEMVPISKDEF